MATIKLPLGLEAEIRGMKGSEEDLLTNEKKVKAGEALDEVIANCTLRLGELKVVQRGDIERLAAPDRMALLMAIRRETFGDEMDVTLRCENPRCGDRIPLTVDLSQLPYREAKGEPPYDIKLSDGTTVRFNFLDGKKDRQLSRMQSNQLTAAMQAQIEEVSGVHKNDIRRWLTDLDAKLRVELRNQMEAFDCGWDVVATADCPSCGEENRFNVVAQPGFFFPGK